MVVTTSFCWCAFALCWLRFHLIDAVEESSQPVDVGRLWMDNTVPELGLKPPTTKNIKNAVRDVKVKWLNALWQNVSTNKCCVNKLKKRFYCNPKSRPNIRWYQKAYKNK